MTIEEVFKDAMKKVVKAAIATVNIQAALARKNAIEKIESDLTLRNQWTKKGVAFDKCPPSATKLEDIESEVGARERISYMARQETGGPHRPRNAGRAVIPMPTARGGSDKNVVRNRFRLSQRKRVKGKVKNPLALKSEKSRFVAMAWRAATDGLWLPSGKTLFLVTKFVRGRKSASFKMTPYHTVQDSAPHTPASPWLEPSSKKPAEDGQMIFNSQLDKIFNS